MDTKELVEELMNNVNVMGAEEQMAMDMHHIVSRSHRTLQQSYVNVLHQFLALYAENQYDLRNEGAVRFAKQVSELDAHFPYI